MITESPSPYDHLEDRSVAELLHLMNQEDRQVPEAVTKALPAIERLILKVAGKMLEGGRLFYIGSGTSGRLGVVDAAECPPTFGVPPGMVVGVIAGGEGAIRQAAEFAEDDRQQGWRDLHKHYIDQQDVLIGISASGTTPYVLGAMEEARKAGIITGCVTCNPDSPLEKVADLPIVVVTGPEFVTGSTRLKAGTATKLILNMISTAVMIRLGRVKGNRMVDMQLTNEKLFNRGTRMIMADTGLPEAEARSLLNTHGSVREAIRAFEMD